MSFRPKKKIPTIAAAGLALVGCGEDSSSQFQQAAERIDRFDPDVTAFCMKYVPCHPDSWFFDDLDSCRAFVLGYMDAYAELSDDPEACMGAVHSYFECFDRTSCSAVDVECAVELEAIDSLCYYGSEEPQ